MTTKTYQLFCLSEAVSQITHASRSEGNESVVAREPVMTDRGVMWVPVLSGNALRHRCVRAPGARWLIDRYNLRGKLTMPQLNALLHGGNLTEGGGRDNTRRIADMQRLFPLFRLLGFVLPDQILSGSLIVQRGTLVCEENRTVLTSLLPDGWDLPAEALRPAEDFVGGYQYVRGDAARTAPDLLPEPGTNGTVGRGADADGTSNQMIFSGQAVTRGALFAHGFTLQHVSTLELGAMLLSLRLWQESGGTVGGQGARGHGRLATAVHLSEGDAGLAVAEYVAHADASRDEAVAWLDNAFAGRTPKSKKEKVNV